MKDKEELTSSTNANENPVPLDMKIVFITGHKGSHDEYVEAYADFVRRGYLVLNSPSFSTTGYNGKDAEDLYRQEVRNSIQIASLVYVVNPEGYIDRLAREDIKFAESLNKKIEYYEENIREDDVYKYIDETYQLTIASLKEKFGNIEAVLVALETITFGYRFMSDEEEQKLRWKPKELPESAIPIVRIFMLHSEPVLNVYYANVWISVFTQDNSLKVNITYPKEGKDRYGQPKQSELWIDLKSRSIIVDTRAEGNINPISMIVTNQILDAINDKFTKERLV